MFQQDLYLVIGIVIIGFSVPSLLGAMADRRSPRVAAVAIGIGAALVMLALSQKPGGYAWLEIPEAFVRVVAHYWR